MDFKFIGFESQKFAPKTHYGHFFGQSMCMRVLQASLDFIPDSPNVLNWVKLCHKCHFSMKVERKCPDFVQSVFRRSDNTSLSSSFSAIVGGQTVEVSTDDSKDAAFSTLGHREDEDESRIDNNNNNNNNNDNNNNKNYNKLLTLGHKEDEDEPRIKNNNKINNRG